MKSTLFQFIIVYFSFLNEVLCVPYHSFSRSVPGKLRSSSEPSTIKEYISRYLEMMKQQDKQQIPVQYPNLYDIPIHEPTYQRGYISRRPKITPETIAALLPYLPSQTERSDYDYGVDPAPDAYDEANWYDEIVRPEILPTQRERANNQEAALLQLFLDHLAGKYSLEDLETLERQAAIEDNTENQLQALMPRKKSKLGSRLTARDILGFSEHQGQKEEPFIVPASHPRKALITRGPISEAQKWDGRRIVDTKTSYLAPRAAEKKSNSMNGSKLANKSETMPSTSTLPPNSDITTMNSELQSAYEAFMSYLDQERFLRKAADEAKNSPRKRFVSEPRSLTRQLESLKKTVV